MLGTIQNERLGTRQILKVEAGSIATHRDGSEQAYSGLMEGTEFEEEETRMPPVNERLGCLRPSRELLEYYRSQIAEYDSEYDKLLQKLDKYKCTYQQVHKNQWEIRQREDEIRELQKALSDMQVFLFQERDHVLRLYAENDRLKIRELEDRKRIQHLLSLTQPVSTETTYFHKEPPAKVIIQQHSRRKGRREDGERRGMGHRESSSIPEVVGIGRGPGGHKSPSSREKAAEGGDSDPDKPSQEDHESLLLSVEALKAQLEEQTRLCKEQVDALLEDRRVRSEESHALHDRDTERIKALTDQLHVTQNLLYDSTKDYLDLKYEYRAKERDWMTEKDQLLRQLDHCKEQLDISEGVDPVLGMSIPGGDVHGPRGATAKHLHLQLKQAQQLADNYREQCIAMEEEMCKLQEQTEASKTLFKQRSEKMSKRLGLMNSRYEALERKRALEIEGYKNDIKLLRQRLKEVEKQLYKLTMTLSSDQDMEILTQVKKTATRSKKLMGDLQNLKAKIYSLENDARHVHD